MQHDRCSGKQRGTSAKTSVPGEPSGRHVLSVGGAVDGAPNQAFFRNMETVPDIYCIWIFISVTMPSNSPLHVSSLT